MITWVPRPRPLINVSHDKSEPVATPSGWLTGWLTGNPPAHGNIRCGNMKTDAGATARADGIDHHPRNSDDLNRDKIVKFHWNFTERRSSLG